MAADPSRFGEADSARITTCELSYSALLQHVPQLQYGQQKPDVLEVDCGSGILSSMLAPHVHTLTGIAFSEAEVAAFNAKAAHQGAQHMEAIHFNRDTPDFQVAPQTLAKLVQKVDGAPAEATRRWNLIISSQTTQNWPVLKDWFQISLFSLAPGGQTVLIDFENEGPESALFYPSDKRGSVVEYGLRPDEVAQHLKDVGFVDVSVQRVFSLKKAVDPAEAGGRTSVEFPFVLCRGTKPSR